MKIRKNMRILKKMATVALTAALALSPFATVADSGDFVYAAEEETPKGYTPIYDIAGLYAIRNDLAGNYILMNDIDMTKDTSEGGDYNCGTGWDSIEEFRGTFDGNGHRIIGMQIFGEFTNDYVNLGFFEELSGATVKNLGIVDCNIDITIDGYGLKVGSIAGLLSSGTVDGCYSSGKVTVRGIDNGIGGLIGQSIGSSISNCYNRCEIDYSGINGKTYVGGIFGMCNIWDSRNFFRHLYNAGSIKGENAMVGAIAGYVCISLKNCQYLKTTASKGVGNKDDNPDCVALSEAQMKNEKLFTGYDFDAIWEVDPYCAYPFPQLKSNRMIQLKSISLKSQPEKTVYNQGETLQINDVQMDITYEDGIKTTIPLTQDMLSGYDMMQIGTQTVIVTYGGIKTSFGIEVKAIPVSGITIPKTVSIYRSKEQLLTPVITPSNATDKKVSWESSRPEIVSVDQSGRIKAKAAGSAVITVTASNGITANCTVTVLVPAVSIQLSQRALSLKEGESFSITAAVLPYESTDSIKWRSGNSAVAEVYEGCIVAKKAGVASIIAYTESGVQGVCAVTVQKRPAQQNTENEKPSGGQGTVDSGGKPNSGSTSQTGGKPNSGSTSQTGVTKDSAMIHKVKATKAKIKSIKNVKSKSMKLKLSGLSNCDAYQIQYSMKKSFKGVKTVTKKSGSVTIKKLKLKKTYYVRVRTMKKIGGASYYGKWSGRKTVRIKK